MRRAHGFPCAPGYRRPRCSWRHCGHGQAPCHSHDRYGCAHSETFSPSCRTGSIAGRVGRQRGANSLALFSRPPAEPCMHLSMHTALQFSLSSIRLFCGFSCVYCPMAVPTYHEGLATHGYHHLYPQWFFPSSLSLEVTEFTDMVNRDVILASAEFTCVPK